MTFAADSVILFQGDSVTDCDRDRAASGDLGHGYAAKVARHYAGQPLRFLNRGISGNRVKDLQARWQEDCIDLQPALVSILIGINDTWRRYDNNDPTSTAAYLEGYHELLSQVRDRLQARILLMDPFVLPVPPDRRAWREDLNPRIDGVRDLAREFGAVYVPLDGIFAEASTRKPCEFWAADGVHPTDAGHQLIAEAWIQAAENM